MKFEGDKIDENNEKEESSNKKEKLTEKMRENPWILSTLVLGILILILLVGNFSGGMTGNVISEKDAGDIILNFVKTQTNGQGELVETNVFDNSLYEVIILYQGNEVPLYITKDGKNLVQGILPLENIEQNSSQSEKIQDIPKSDKPKVELFIMTHCPYGAQAEKGIIPTIKALGNSVDAKIRFVHYFMHGDKEETETYNQVCIREEQSVKYLDYLQCFLEDGNSERCLTKTKIDKNKLETCISSGKSKEYYAEDSKLSEAYGVQGSPTLVVNGMIVSSGRDSASYLGTICSAFNNAPEEECNKELSSTSPSPGFGTGTGSSASTANCGA